MLKKVIHYTDYEGNEKESVEYFNLTRAECLDLDLEYEADGGLLAHLKNLFANKVDGELPRKPAVDFIKLLVARSYGVRPENDPGLFLKEDDDGKPLYKRFKQTKVFQDFVYQLLTGEESLEEFATNVMPNVPDADMETAKAKLRADGFGELVDLSEAAAGNAAQLPTASNT